MLWDVIYEFFIKYIFGGFYGGVEYGGTLGSRFSNGNTILTSRVTGITFSGIGTFSDQIGELSLGNYLSLIGTIITLVAILLFCIFIIKKIIGVMFRLFTFGA